MSEIDRQRKNKTNDKRLKMQYLQTFQSVSSDVNHVASMQEDNFFGKNFFCLILLERPKINFFVHVKAILNEQMHFSLLELQ